MKERIYLSPPNVDHEEEIALVSALQSGWVAPVGPHLDQFEEVLSAYYQGKKVLLLNSGTSALHLSLVLSGVGEGDLVLSSSMTFAACANVIAYQKAISVFIDSEQDTWNMDPKVLEDYLKSATTKPKAILVTHLYGAPARIAQLKNLSEKYGITLIEDAAESLGAFHHGKPVGTFGTFGIISFNGNKTITTSGGGALICDDEHYVKGLHLATQANQGNGEYLHDQVGYNYRMSNILASLGQSQFEKLKLFLKRKKEIFERYQTELSNHMDFPEEVKENQSSYWLTTAILKPGKVRDLIQWLERNDIESRRLWKPLHLQEAFYNYEFVGEGVCEKLFHSGICLPSGSGLTYEQQSFVIHSIMEYFAKKN